MVRQCLHETVEDSTGGEETGGGAGGGAVGVIVGSSLASAANCLEERCAMAAGQQTNRKQRLCECVLVTGNDHLQAQGTVKGAMTVPLHLPCTSKYPQ